jgi:hypothetical protein
MFSCSANRGFQSLVSVGFTNHFAAEKTANSSAATRCSQKRKWEKAHRQSSNPPRKIATELIEEEECRSSLSQVSGGAHGHRA